MKFIIIFFSVLAVCFGLGCNNQVGENLVGEKKDVLNQEIDSFSILYSIGNQKLSSNDFQGAISVFSKIISTNQSNADSYYCRGYSLSALGKDSAAIIDYNSAIKLMPEYKGAYFSRGVSYGIIGNYNAALSDYDKVLALDSLFSNAFYNRGTIYLKIGKKEKAHADMSKAAFLNDPRAMEFLK